MENKQTNTWQEVLRKFLSTRVPLKFLLVFLVLLVLPSVLILGYHSNCEDRVRRTKFNLIVARSRVKAYKETTGSYPICLAEIKEYAEKHPESNLGKRHFKEYLSIRKGNLKESADLNDTGGWYYNKTAGEVKINIIKPVKHYLTFYFGEERNEIPSDW